MKILNYKKGFTLIEMVVVIAVFLFVVGAAVGIFISIIDGQKKVLAEEQLLNQVSYIEEYMSKALRMAVVDTTVTDPGGTCIDRGNIYQLTRHDLRSGFYRGIKFINQSDNDACLEFFLDKDGVLKELRNSDNDNDAVALTSNNLQFDTEQPISLAINGSINCNNVTPCSASNKDGIQPRVTLLLNIAVPGEKVPRKIQTTVSQRNLNVSQ